MKEIKPNLYIIPGWGDTPKFKYSQPLINIAKEKYNVVPIHYISKKGQLLSANIEQSKKQIISPSRNDTIFGFSIGALIAFQLASKLKFKLAIICSLSPVLEEDLLLYPDKELEKIFGLKVIEEMKSMKYGKPKCPVVFIIGSLEPKEAIIRARKLHKKYGGKIILIKGANHAVEGKYLEEVKKQINLHR